MKALLCDVGGVLLDVDFQRAINRLSSTLGISGEAVHRRVFSSGIKDRHDAGLVSSFEFYKHIVPDDEISYEHFEAMWSDVFSEKKDVIEHIRFCSKFCRLYIASNTDPIHFSYFVDRYPAFSLFDGFGLSFNLKKTKPDPDFFVTMCREFYIDYHDALVVDDLQQNVEAAQELGIRSHLFVNTDGLKAFMDRSIKEV